MPGVLTEQDFDAVDAAIAFAQQVRKLHRRRSERASPARRRDIRMALNRLGSAMKPLRSELGRLQYAPTTAAAEARHERVRDASKAIQTERRKLWKMR